MQQTWINLSALALLTVCTAACSDADDGDPSDIETETMPMVAIDYPSEAPVEGARICIRETGACGTADDTGQLDLAVPVDGDYIIEVAADDYMPGIFPIRGDASDDEWMMLMVKVAVVDALYATMGVERDPAKGVAAGSALTVDGDGVAGVTGELSPASGTPYFFDADGVPTTMGATSAEVPFFGYVNVDPGEVTLSGSHPDLVCENAYGPLGSTPNSVKVPVEAGTMTIVSRLECR